MRGVDFVEDQNRQRRRQTLRRAMRVGALGIALLALGVGFKVLAKRRDLSRAIDHARVQYVAGTPSDLQASAELLETTLLRYPDDRDTLGMLALVRAHLWLEFGVGHEDAVIALEAAPEGTPARTLARAMLAFAEGNVEAAAQGDASVVLPADENVLLYEEQAWLHGLVAAARGREDPSTLPEARRAIEARLEQSTHAVPLRRVLAFLLFSEGDYDKAFDVLDKARDQSRSHFGLAADQALYNARLRRQLGGVASVADQLLAVKDRGLAKRDEAHVQLARAVAHVRSGEPVQALALLDEAWPGLAAWNTMTRELAIETALESGDATRLATWLPASGLRSIERDIYRAWGTLLDGKIMEALDELEHLPQEHVLVGYLQALALVEQGRFVEAKPWLERTAALMPGRLEVEVAEARVELRLGDAKMALRKLEAIAEEEPYAPRAWTGYGEALLLQSAELRDAREAKRALLRAIEREPIPAEAMLQLAFVWNEKRASDAEAERKALELLERASQTNPHLPRYRGALALYLADLGYDERALALLRSMSDERGLEAPVLLRRGDLEVETSGGGFEVEPLLDQARQLGADARALELLRARAAVLQGTRKSLTAAEATLRELLAKNEADVDARILLVEVEVRRYDLESAKALLLRGLAATPEAQEGRLHFALADIQARFGRYQAAAPRARHAWIRMREEDRPAAELLDAAALATRLWVRNKRERVALAIAKELTTRIAYHPRAWTIRAATELSANEFADARGSAERAIELDPSSADAHELRGHCLLRFGRREEARLAYERAVSLAPARSEFKENLTRF